MKIYALDICPTNKTGLCNQLYSIVAGIKYCTQNQFNVIVIKQFLKSINSENYCDVSDVIDLNKLNEYLKSNNIFINIIDYKFVDVNIKKTLEFQTNFTYEQDKLFFNILRNISFSTSLINDFITNNNQITTILNNKINTIHLRIEDDLLEHYMDKLNINKELLRIIIENKYISIIEKYFNKNDVIILLTYSFDNSVIDFLNLNGYKYIINEKKSVDREISAIYDLMLGEYCNNYYICVWESSYSYTLFSRINTKKGVKALQIYYENLNRKEDVVSLLY